jgi:transcriptional regulator with XRE-family HTH domain
VTEDEQGAPQAPTWGPVGPPPELWREPDEIAAANVRRVRKLRGLSGRELEERAGLRGRYVSDLERGRLKGGPSVSEVVRIALALSVSPLALVIPWHEDEDEQHVMYVKQGTFGVLFPGGTAGVEAAARLWSGRISEAFAHVVNVSEYRTTLPSFSRDGDEHGAARVLEDGKAVELPSGTVWYPDERAIRLPGGYRLSLGGEEWDGTDLDEWTEGP